MDETPDVALPDSFSKCKTSGPITWPLALVLEYHRDRDRSLGDPYIKPFLLGEVVSGQFLSF